MMVDRIRRGGPALAAILLLGLAPAAQEPGRVTGIFDVAPLVTAQGDEENLRFSALLAPRSGFSGEDLLLPGGEAVPPVPPAELEDWLSSRLEPETHLALQGGRLVVTGTQAQVDRTGTLLAGLKRGLGGVKLRVTWFEAASSPFAFTGGLQDAERTAALVEALGRGGELRILAGTEMTLRPGGRAAWKRIENRSLLSGYEAAVASKVAVANPQMAFLPQGCMVRIQYCPMPGGGAGLFVDGWRGFDLAGRKVVLAMPQVPWLELGAANLAILTGNGAPLRGESLLFCDWAVTGRNTFLLVEVLDAPAPGKDLAFTGPLFLGWHRNRGLLQPPLPMTGLEEPMRDAWRMVGGGAAGFADPLFDQELFPTICREAGLGVEKVLSSGILLVGAGWRADRWRQLEERLSGPLQERTARVEFQWKGLPRAEADSLDGEALYKRGRLLRRLVLPLMEERTALFLSGRERQFVQNYYVEVAEESSQAIPQVRAYWSGTTGRITLGRDGAFLVLEDHRLGEPQVVATGKASCGVLERVDHTHCRRHFEIPRAPRFQVLGDTVSPVAGGEEELRVVVGCTVH